MMRHTITPALMVLIAIIFSLGFSNREDEGKVHLKVTKEENGEKSIFEKVYASMEELKSDVELKKFDVLVDRWINDQGHLVDPSGDHTMIIREKFNGDHEKVWITEDDRKIHTDDKHIVVKKKDGTEETIDVKKEKTVKIKTDDGEKVFTKKNEEGSEGDMVWVDKDGNKTTFTDEDIDKMIQELDDGEAHEIHKKIEVTTSEDNDEEKHITIMNSEGDHTSEIEVDVQTEIDGNGNEKTINKKVWITKGGKKVELDGENSFEFETEGDRIKIKVDDETMDIADFDGGKFEGDNIMIIQKKGDGEPGTNQTMNINIEEQNGDKFIEIEIERSSKLNVTISDIVKDDAALKYVDIPLKNNLKTSELNYYPNPSNGNFNLKFMLDQQDEVTVKVMDILGNDVYKETLMDFNGAYDNQIDLSGKDSGIYILQIIQKKKALSRKILIE